MALIYAKPAVGIELPLPDGRPWPLAGEWVDDADRYVRRRLADDDIVAAEPPPEPEGAAEADVSEPAGEVPAAAAEVSAEAPASEPADAIEAVRAPAAKTSGKRGA